MAKKIPPPRRPERAFVCPWCGATKTTLADLQAHGDVCPKRPK